jgi:hypothetical protein
VKLGSIIEQKALIRSFYQDDQRGVPINRFDTQQCPATQSVAGQSFEKLAPHNNALQRNPLQGNLLRSWLPRSDSNSYGEAG